MTNFSRRDFIKLAGLLAASSAMPGSLSEVFAAGLEKMATNTRVIWLQGQSCSGDSISLLNTIDPTPEVLLTKYISLVIHQNIGAAQGNDFMATLDNASQAGDYLVVIEGSIPMSMPEACMIGERSFEDILLGVLPKAKAILAVGTCSAFGGIPAAEGNETGAGSVRDFMNKHQIPYKGKLIHCPSCPTHPKSIVGTLAYVAAKGYPEVDDELLIPKMFYSTSTHDNCPRYHYFERKIFSSHFGDSQGCLFKLGCLGPLTHTPCPNRQWNSGVNWCFRAASPCIGCSSPDFAKKKDFPFYRIREMNESATQV